MNAEREQLRNEMAALRSSLGDEFEHTVAGLRTMTDWRQLVRHHPWACLGAAAIAGFTIVPSKSNLVLKADANSLKEITRGSGLRLNTSVAGSGPVGSIARMVTGMVARAAVAYVTQRVSSALTGAQQTSTNRRGSP